MRDAFRTREHQFLGSFPTSLTTSIATRTEKRPFDRAECAAFPQRRIKLAVAQIAKRDVQAACALRSTMA